MSTTLTASKYQIAIENHFTEMLSRPGVRETLVVSARAGSGKTTVLERLCAMLPREDAANAVALAFNKAIVEEMGARLAPTGVKCSTLNSLGNQALWQHFQRKRMTVDGYKYKNLLAGYLENMAIPKKVFADTLTPLNQLLTFSMSSLAGYDKETQTYSEPLDEQLDELLQKYGIDIPPALSSRDMFNLIRSGLREGQELARSRRLISYDDQIVLPVIWNTKIPQYKYIFVDESNDLSPAKLELSLRAGNGDSKYIYVGDEKQSIFGFAGADIDSIPQIIKRTNATVLPLSVCYRCAKNIILEVQKVMPDIEAAPDAIDGVVRTIMDTELESQIQEGDMILCRTNAPLISLAIKLIGQRIPAKVKGRDIGTNLVAFAKTVLGKRGEWKYLPQLLEEYAANQTVALQQKKNPEGQIEALKDKVACTEALYQGLNAQSIEEYAAAVNNIFSDSDALVELSSCHRSKGLGRDRVFIIHPEKLPLVWKGQRDWEYQQEVNLHYVALSRAKKELVYVTTSPKKNG